ncbi:Ribulokinase-like protein [Scheffersomyces xylosifermentans]|uniref:Ribulokinase-like protein n=1 Tax=Scheffersomyces xylosifermentans TaxID=1304137 RepID=UPI00315DC44C
MSVTLGIDVGTGSVRLYLNDGGKGESYEAETTTYHSGNFITQSSNEIFNKILGLISNLKNKDDVRAIGTTATCSMVVLEKVQVDGVIYLKPFDAISGNDSQQKEMQDIILWMDNRATEETKHLNSLLKNKDIAKYVGGSFVPELGVPKLKWLSDNFPGRQLVCFELYDWINYLLLVGGFNEDCLVEYKAKTFDFEDKSYAIDGSIKGWPRAVLTESFGISENIEVGGADFQIGSASFPRVGMELGQAHTLFGFNGALIGNGCIDSYSGWLANISEPNGLEDPIGGTLAMVAGTSTCFVIASEDESVNFIPNIWGPFNQIIPGVRVYELGQPSTGKLFQRLFNTFDKFIRKNVSKDAAASSVFEYLEQETLKLSTPSITQVIRNYFYYGDVDGNRNPISDNTMSEMVIDGFNYDRKLAPIIDNNEDNKSFVIKYNLILEFLCFQTRHIVETLQNGGFKIEKIRVSGSQAKNRRFLELLSNVTQLRVTCVEVDSKYNVARGASFIGNIARTGKFEKEKPLHTSFTTSYSNWSKSEILPTDKDKDLLLIKYGIFRDMIEMQTKFRRLVNRDY